MRDLRHKLRAQLSWAGFGSPAPGVWISPKTDAEAEAKVILDELKLTGQTTSFLSQHGSLGRERDMVEAAWDLGKVADLYEGFIDGFTGLAPRSPDEMLMSQIKLVDEWRRFPFLDPQLPHALLPPRWSGTTASALFARKHAEWAEPAKRRWREIAHRDD
ncbi:PaaX family transcriptional regulator C-terminal domain-containing protein [Amycolatopsis thermoflava]|uniref:PaaX family transcriptional regulator C-terminal domain-containing protein n=1 Tax=Amycolatopsis thermoflava TaxID=84480 RepID=UPI0038CC0C29